MSAPLNFNFCASLWQNHAMALLEIVKWPAPVLDTPADPVTEFDDDLKRLVNNMFETMYAAPGVGLAAVQVGVPQRLFVMDCSGGKDPSQRVTLINPEVLRVEGNQNGEEGCLSFPGSLRQSSAACVRSCARRMLKASGLSSTAWS